MAGVSVVHLNGSQTASKDIIILRKTPHILPKDYSKDDVLLTNAARKKGKGKGAAPPPLAVARRNARERNRVKQVNNGFANLRQHIPSFIAQAFEANSRGGNKKLSKVETLRMAVEYIRSLEDLLALEDNGSETSNSPSSSTHPHYQDEDTNTPPPQYAYQIIPGHLYEEGESLEPLEDHLLSDPSLMEMEFRGAQDLSLLNNVSDSLSPGMYSEQSLSPEGRGCVLEGEVRSEEVPVISLKTENELPQQHKTSVMDVMQWWEQQQDS